MSGFELYKKLKIIDGNVEVCFITALENYHEEFKESFPMLDEAKPLSENQKQWKI
jgi:hypothetical protein